MIRNTQQASAPHFLPGALFHLQNAPDQRRKRAPYAFDFLFLPPIEVAAMSTSPHASTLCPMLPNHFILHAKSLARLALRAPPTQRLAFVPSLLRYTYIYIYIIYDPIPSHVKSSSFQTRLRPIASSSSRGDVPEGRGEDAANYVNRSPVPAFHFLRPSAVEDSERRFVSSRPGRRWGLNGESYCDFEQLVPLGHTAVLFDVWMQHRLLADSRS